MGGGAFEVTRVGEYDFVYCKYLHRVSVLSNLSVVDYVNFPFDKDAVSGMVGCDKLLCFYSVKGEIVLRNLELQKWIALPPLLGLAKFLPSSSDSDSDRLSFIRLATCGIGYDAKSGEHKVIVNYTYSSMEEDLEQGGKSFTCKEYLELFSLNSFSWKSIRAPDYFLVYGGVYLEKTGRCYWIATSFPVDSKSKAYYGDRDMSCHVMSFDFATEEFDHFPLPATGHGKSIGSEHELFQYRGSIVVNVYPYLGIVGKPFVSCVQIFVWKLEEKLWDMLYDVSLPCDVMSPLGLKEDGSSLFLEVRASGERRQLMVYDLVTKTSKKLNIFDCPTPMRIAECSEKRGIGKVKKRSRSRRVKVRMPRKKRKPQYLQKRRR